MRFERMPLHEHFPEGHVQTVAKVWNFVQPFKIVRVFCLFPVWVLNTKKYCLHNKPVTIFCRFFFTYAAIS